LNVTTLITYLLSYELVRIPYLTSNFVQNSN